MTTYIIKSISADGMETELLGYRWKKPAAGDLVDMIQCQHRDEYPYNTTKNRYGLIEGIGVHGYENKAHIAIKWGSAFMGSSGHVSISGGPTVFVDKWRLKPLFDLRPVTFWTWQNGRAGADNGVSYTIDRPVFMLIPSDGELKYIDEQKAKAPEPIDPMYDHYQFRTGVGALKLDDITVVGHKENGEEACELHMTAREAYIAHREWRQRNPKE